MSRSLVFLALLLLISTPAWAGSQADPEISDPAGDQSETNPGLGDSNGVPGGGDRDFSDTDVTLVWVTETNATTLGIFVQTEAAAQASTKVTIDFTVEAGPTSVFGSTANGQAFTIESTGTTLDSGPATKLTQVDTILLYEMPLAAIGASGGDVISELSVATTRTQAAGCQVLCTAQTGTDSAPDSGTGREYTLSRNPIVGEVDLAITGGTIVATVIDQGNGTGNATSTEQTRDFVGPSLNTTDVNASIIYRIEITNSGTDADTYNLSILAPSYLIANNVTATLDVLQLNLTPGATGMVELSLKLANTPVGEHGFVVSADSIQGARGVVAALLEVVSNEPPAPTPTTPAPQPETNTTASRSPLIGEGTFLQDAAEALGFDSVFDDYAELVLLALAILLLVLVIFLIFIIAGRGWIRVTVTPKHATVGPGETAEFKVEVKNRKRRFSDALAYFEGDTSWKTGVLLKPDSGAPVRPLTSVGDEAEFSIGAREEPGDHLEGTLRIQAPADAGDKERDSVRLNIVPVASDGIRQRRKGGSAKVTVRASNPGVAAPSRATSSNPSIPVRMSNVLHDPPNPAPGQSVTTTATLENDSSTETLRLRVVLRLDGADVEEEIVEVPPRSARAVLFPWRAGDGANRVKVQVFQA